MTDHRLPAFTMPSGFVSSQRDRWYKGSDFHILPSVADLRRDGPEAVLAGWKPPAPIIHADTKLFAMGSCFAAHFSV
jgi:hypothetical protein